MLARGVLVVVVAACVVLCVSSPVSESPIPDEADAAEITVEPSEGTPGLSEAERSGPGIPSQPTQPTGELPVSDSKSKWMNFKEIEDRQRAAEQARLNEIQRIQERLEEIQKERLAVVRLIKTLEMRVGEADVMAHQQTALAGHGEAETPDDCAEPDDYEEDFENNPSNEEMMAQEALPDFAVEPRAEPVQTETAVKPPRPALVFETMGGANDQGTEAMAGPLVSVYSRGLPVDGPSSMGDLEAWEIPRLDPSFSQAATHILHKPSSYVPRPLDDVPSPDTPMGRFRWRKVNAEVHSDSPVHDVQETTAWAMMNVPKASSTQRVDAPVTAPMPHARQGPLPDDNSGPVRGPSHEEGTGCCVQWRHVWNSARTDFEAVKYAFTDVVTVDQCTASNPNGQVVGVAHHVNAMCSDIKSQYTLKPLLPDQTVTVPLDQTISPDSFGPMSVAQVEPSTNPPRTAAPTTALGSRKVTTQTVREEDGLDEMPQTAQEALSMDAETASVAQLPQPSLDSPQSFERFPHPSVIVPGPTQPFPHLAGMPEAHRTR